MPPKYSILTHRPQINCREVARLFGQDATYNAIENFLRKPKQEAKKLRAEAAGTTGPAPSPAKKVTTPKKSSGSVLDGEYLDVLICFIN